MRNRARRWAHSYRGRLVFGYALVVAVFGIAWAWSLFGPLTDALVRQQERSLMSIADAGAAMVDASDLGWQQIADTLGQTSGARITIVETSGAVLADSRDDADEMENHASRPEIADALAGRIGRDRRVSRTEGTEQLYIAVSALRGGERVAVRASESVTSIDQLIVNSRRLGELLLVVALALAMIIAATVSRNLAEPIQRLSSAAERMASGDLGVDIPQPPGELGILGDSLAELRRQIRGRIEDLEAEQQSMRAVLDGLGDAVFLLQGEVISFGNRAADELFRMPYGGWRNHDIGSVNLPAPLCGRIKSLIGAPEALAEELSPDPTGRTLRLVVAPIVSGDTAPRTLVVISDVTERARLDRIRRDFVANASHELKTPVAGIQLLAESAARAAEDGDDQQALGFALQIEDQSTRLRRLVKDLLDLSRLESATMAEAITDVREGVRGALTGHRIAAETRGLNLAFEDLSNSVEDVYAKADSTDFAVALDNLLDNAITYTESGEVRVELAADADTVRLSVVDTGIGIPEKDLPRIFERFYRVDPARSRDSGGTGLGLSLVRHFVERSGGTVAVESNLGSGSRFTLTFARAH